MRKIETRILDATAVNKSERAMLAAARLTQRGHEIHNMSDFIKLYNKKLDFNQIESLAALPHPTLQKFGVINVAVVGLSRRALAQITRHLCSTATTRPAPGSSRRPGSAIQKRRSIGSPAKRLSKLIRSSESWGFRRTPQAMSCLRASGRSC